MFFDRYHQIIETDSPFVEPARAHEASEIVERSKAGHWTAQIEMVLAKGDVPFPA